MTTTEAALVRAATASVVAAVRRMNERTADELLLICGAEGVAQPEMVAKAAQMLREPEAAVTPTSLALAIHRRQVGLIRGQVAAMVGALILEDRIAATREKLGLN